MTSIEFIVFLPLLAALAIMAGAPARATAIGTAVVGLIAALLVAFWYGEQGGDVHEVGSFGYSFTSSHTVMTGAKGQPLLSLAFGIDGMSLVMVLLSALVLLAAVLVSPPEKDIQGGPRLYYISSLLIAGGALGAFCSTDLFFFYAFHELALIPTFLMIGLHGHGENRVKTAWTITLYLGAGSLVLLVGLVALFFIAGGNTFSIPAMISQLKEGEGSGDHHWIYLVLLVGFGTLVSLFPFHTWAARAYAEAPTPTAMLHSGVLKKFGLYGLLRVAQPMLPEGAAYWQNLVLILLLGNILFVGYATLAQRRLDLLLGNSSVMHMGYVFLGIASASLIGIHGAVLLMFAHGVSIALLFALCGKLRERTGTTDIAALGGGLATPMPRLGILFALGAFASIGLPGFANFASEILVFFGAFEPMLKEGATTPGPLQWACILALWGVVISAVYMLRAFRSVFKGPVGESRASLPDLTPGEMVPLIILVGALVIVGFAPQTLLNHLTPSLELFKVALGR